MGDCCTKAMKNGAIDDENIEFISTPASTKAISKKTKIIDDNLTAEECEFLKKTTEIRSADNTVNVI